MGFNSGFKGLKAFAASLPTFKKSSEYFMKYKNKLPEVSEAVFLIEAAKRRVGLTS